MNFSSLNIPYQHAIRFEGTDVFVVRLQPGYAYFQNDIQLKSEYNLLASTDNIVIRTTTSPISHYVHKVNDHESMVSVQDYQALYAEMRSRHCDSDNNPYSRKDQLAMEIFAEEYSAVYGKIVTNTAVTIKFLADIIEPKSEFITCLLAVGKSASSGNLYCLNLRGVEQSVWNTVIKRFPSCVIERTTHSYMRYVKVNTKYIFDDTWNEKRPEVLYGSLDYCQKYEDDYRVKLAVEFDTAIRATDVSLNDIKVIDLINRLNQIWCSIRDIPTSSKKADEARRATMSQCRNLTNEINEFISKTGG